MSTTNEFPLNPIDGTLVELDKGDNTSVVYKYDADDAAWKIVGKNGGTQQLITTSDVNTTMDPPTTPAGWTGLNVQEDLSYLTDQKHVNWFLAEQIILNKDENEDRPPIISISPPTSHPKFAGEPLEEGDFWIDGNNIMSYWTGSEWQEVLDSEHYQSGDYVKKKGGDSMEGQLTITGPRKAGDDVDNPNLVSSLKVLNIDNAQNSSLQLRHSGNAKVYIGDTDISVASDIKFNRAQGAVVKTNVQDLLNISDREIAYLGQSIEDEDLITKKYVDDAKDFLQNEIIELEEEIEAIAPSVERGKWTFTAVGTVANPGQFTMYDADFGNGDPTGLFKSAKSIWFNEIDSDGTPHAFADVDDGELLEIFVDGSPEYGLFEVVGQAHDETQTGTKFWVIDVNFVRSLEATTAVGPGELCRFKVFMAPTGGDASSFVLKTGDTMEGPGPLTIKTKKTSNDYNSPGSNTAYIKFENDNNGSINSLSLYRGGPDKTLIADGGFTARGHIWSSGHYYAYNGSSTRFPSLRLEENEGKLAWGSSTGYAKLKWNTRGISEMMFNNSIGETGQVPTKTDAGIEWVTPGQVLTNWDLINANDKNWGNEFYHNALITGFGGYKSNGDEYNGQSNYGIFISDSMLEKLLKEDYPDKEIDIDKWVKYWTGEGTIELNTGNSGANGTSQTRTLTEVKRVNYNNDGRYPGVKLMWADQASLSFYSLFIKFVKTAGAFEAGEVNTIQVPASNILYYTGSYTPSREEDVNDSTVYWLDRNGNISNSTPSNGAFFPWAWIKENYPWMTGLNIMDGLGVSGIYDAFGNAKSLLDPTKTFNSFPAYVNPREFNGVRGIGIWSDNQMGSNDRIQLWGLQEAFEYYTINS